jgi:predicted CXXCH cytochrome family protein
MKLIYRLLVGLMFALPLTLVSFALAQASPARQEADPAPECQECHASYQTAWEGGAHSKALVDPVFKEAWDAVGNPKDCLACHTTGFDPATGTSEASGVTCAACHDPVPANHPLSPASMSLAADKCGACHTDTLFEWQSSQHGESDLTCINCHDPHATSLKTSDTSTLCASCHGTRVAAFAHSSHAEQDLTCTDCHIGETDNELGMGRAKHTHTFAVDLDACTRCHENEIHNATVAMLINAETPVPPESMASGHPTTVSAEPAPTNALGVATFTLLIGLAFGIVLAPALDRGFRRIARRLSANEVRS